MGGARALIASLGASISLVAGAALALLFVSFLFAYDGLGGSIDEPATHAALLVNGGSPVTPRPAGGDSRNVAAVVIRTPAAAPARDVVRRPQRPDSVRESSAGVETRPAPATSSVPDLGAVSNSTATSAPSGSRPAVGDGVRDLGDSVSATVGETGEAAGDATAPLGPPVSQAVQDVLNIVQSLLKGATDGLSGTLDNTLPRR
ncbi:MAG: hypothetical protein QOJ89_4307 [bacterium]|jgi:hypothetical protein